MALSDINLGPSPSADDLKSFVEAGAGCRDAAQLLAEIQWQIELRKRDPDAFLVPFSTEAFPALGFRTYAEYLASPLWRRIKTQELRRAGGKCAACGNITRTIHHRDYRPRVLAGNDSAALVALCQPCHDHVHYAPGKKERSWNEGERVLRKMIEGRLRYFAYGSNMLTGRLRGRVGNCTPGGLAILSGHVLRFHKRSKDGSGKCNAFATGNANDSVLGVLFDISEVGKPILDKAEGLGYCYNEASIEITRSDGQIIRAFTYIADTDHIDDTLKPTAEYRNFVERGAEEHHLAPEYIATWISSVETAN